MKTVIVGGVAAGASTAARLRRLDESAEIVVLERDHYVSFANCGLPYHIGGTIPHRDSLLLQTPESLHKSLALDVRTGQEVVDIDPDAHEVEVRDLRQGGRTYREAYDTLVLCPGAEPMRPPIPGADDPRVDVLRNIPDMDHIIAQVDKGARSAGVEIGPRGGIVVDAQMRTSVPDILAAGDAVETPHLLTGEPVLSMLAGPANREGRIAADTIAGRHSEYRGTQGTAVVKVFDMTAGGTGMTERELRDAGIDHRKVYTHQNGHAAYYPGTAPMFVKALFAPDDGRLLGAQVLGWDGVDKRIDVFAVALRAGMTVYDLEHLELAYAPPYGSAKDPVNMIGFQAVNLLQGDIDLWYPEEYPQCADRVRFLDVRTPAEYEAWHVPEAVLIPYTELRDRLDEVPKDRPVYTYCRSGFRSYIAYEVLRQHGWDDVAFLSGGMITFHGYHRTPLAVGEGGMPVVTHVEDELAQRPGALEHI